MRGWNTPAIQVWYLDDKPLHKPGRRVLVAFSEHDYPEGEYWMWSVTNETGAIVVSGETETEEEAKRVALETAVALEVQVS